MSGSGISWAICKPARRSREITTPAPHYSSVNYRPDALPTTQPTASKHWRQASVGFATCYTTVINCQAREKNKHPLYGVFSRTSRASWYLKGKTMLDINEARGEGVLGWQWHWPDHRQTDCILIQTPTCHHLIFTGQMLSVTSNQQCQSTKGEYHNLTSSAKQYQQKASVNHAASSKSPDGLQYPQDNRCNVANVTCVHIGQCDMCSHEEHMTVFFIYSTKGTASKQNNRIATEHKSYNNISNIFANYSR